LLVERRDELQLAAAARATAHPRLRGGARGGASRGPGSLAPLLEAARITLPRVPRPRALAQAPRGGAEAVTRARRRPRPPPLPAYLRGVLPARYGDPRGGIRPRGWRRGDDRGELPDRVRAPLPRRARGRGTLAEAMRVLQAVTLGHGSGWDNSQPIEG